MKRLHISVNVSDLDRSIAFYSQLFGTAPVLVRDDYAKWLVDDPRVNFVVEKSVSSPGVTHAGIEVGDEQELGGLYEQFKKAGPYENEGITNCCYHRSEKSWTMDPDGFAWEAFYSFDQTEQRGDGRQPRAGCCQ